MFKEHSSRFEATFLSLCRGQYRQRVWMGGDKCQLSVKILAICQLSVKFKAICQLSVN